ncbi:MAG: hypothetical protein M5U28_47175 [Sandaracinaceae bacterium]|nr:hypothetical protein [Sandaracinaceae bacterium]
MRQSSPWNTLSSPVGKKPSRTMAIAAPPGDSSVCVVKSWNFAVSRASPTPAPAVEASTSKFGMRGIRSPPCERMMGRSRPISSRLKSPRPPMMCSEAWCPMIE